MARAIAPLLVSRTLVLYDLILNTGLVTVIYEVLLKAFSTDFAVKAL